MTKIAFTRPKFVKTVVHSKDYPRLRDFSGEMLPEIAVLGRSNVGKSSLLNHLFQFRGMARISSKPGKTQAVNFFSVNDELAFVDLPGYGYANVPLSVRKKWGPMVQTYLEERKSLKLVLFLFDIRRSPNEEDKQLLEWIEYYKLAMILVITKTDKVKRNEVMTNTRKILEAFDAENLHYVHYSVTKNIGRKALIAMLNDAMK